MEIYGSTSSSENSFRKTVVAVCTARAKYLFREGELAEPFRASPQNSALKFVASETLALILELVRAQAYALACRPPHPYADFERPEPSDDERCCQRLAWLPHPMMPDPDRITSTLDVEEPVERVYRCPSGQVTFTERLWDGERHYHLCGSVPRRGSPHYSGIQ